MNVLVFGASLKEERYSHLAILMLREYNYEVVAVGGRRGKVQDVEILTGHPTFSDHIHTITMYMGAARQEEHLDYLIGLKPKRIIFNPGAENPKLVKLAKENGIDVMNACTLVLLRTGQFSSEEST